jgi:hypothetical protein
MCMQDMLWDGIKRDRLVWIGDMHPETQVISYLFGAHPIVPLSLDYVRDDTPLPEWMNGISSYSIWWVLIHHSWYRFHGDRAYLEEQRPYLLQLLAQLRDHIGEDNAEQLDGHRFLDWPTSGDSAAIHMGLHSLLCMAMQAGAELCYVLKAEDDQVACQSAANALRLHHPEPTPTKSANALRVMAGLGEADTVNSEVLARNPLSDISTFYGYYVLQARALAGDYEGAVDVIRNYWGAMLDLGATTFWEDFDLAWTRDAGRIDELPQEGKHDVHREYGDYCYKGLRHSFCHGWAGGPAAWLHEHVLGLTPLEPGCAAVRMAPHLAGLEWAEGTMATPHGPIRVRHEAGPGGAIRSEVDAPDGVRIVKG